MMQRYTGRQLRCRQTYRHHVPFFLLRSVHLPNTVLSVTDPAFLLLSVFVPNFCLLRSRAVIDADRQMVKVLAVGTFAAA